MKLIETIKDRCHECYACVRNCPVKAVKVKDGQAEVIADRCIHCGNCVRVCSQGAKKVKDNLSAVARLLKQQKPVIAGLAPSFPSYNSDLSLKQWVKSLRSIGFNKVYEVAWGAQLIIQPYQKLLAETEDLVISSACPVIVNLIRKYFPDLLANLAPIASPMQALVRYLRVVEGQQDIVLIGPCLAKKAEITDQGVTVLTYSEAATLLARQKKLNHQDYLVVERFEKPNKPTNAARRLPLSGGLLQAVVGQSTPLPEGFLKVEGREKVFDLLRSISKGEIRPRFVDILFCEGCINGVDLNNLNYFIKEMAVNNFINSEELGDKQAIYSPELAADLFLGVDFEKDAKELPQPTEEEIWNILRLTGKYQESDLLNCGACGYSSCREKAIAVYQGLAEVEMCLPYLLSEKRSEIKRVQELNQELDTLINASYDGMVMVNREGRIERTNKAFLDMIKLPSTEVLGKNVWELEAKRILYPSVAKLCLREKREITLIQHTREGERLLTTASPIIDEQGKLLRVVVNTRNLTKLNLGIDHKENEKIKQYLETGAGMETDEANYQIIYHSQAMKEIIDLAWKVSKTNSPVLIMGESGVGKEVIARYIHEHSLERDAFVKINCAAIPESLLESELFGYETGAFSGAKREGKPGLIEKADGGTLFLDEIGEMPLNMQAKLLQVLQEHRVTRIGGTDSIKVNFRLITATNRNLKEMVARRKFREDLYYRLNVVPIYIPPLRERKEDVIPLINYYLASLNQRYNKKIRLSPASIDLLFAYDWPGNVRELANLLERVVVTAEEGEVEQGFIQDFMEFAKEGEQKPIIVQELIPFDEAVKQVEKRLLLMAREKGGSTYQMAELLGVNQSTVVRKLKKYFK